MMKIKARWCLATNAAHRVAICGVWDGDYLISSIYVFATWETAPAIFVERIKGAAQVANEIVADIEALKKWTHPHVPTNGNE